MAEYSRSARGNVMSLTSGGTPPVVLPFLPTVVKWYNYDAAGGDVANEVVEGFWDTSMGQGSGIIKSVDAVTFDLFPDVLTTNGVFTFQAGLALQYGAKQQVVTATKGGITTFTVTAHGYTSGDVVTFQGLYQTPTTGMPQIAGMEFLVTEIDANTFSINWDTTGSNYTALSGSPAGAMVMKVLYPWLYFPGISYISEIIFGSSNTEIVTTAPHTLSVGQEVAFRIPAAWGTVQLNSLPNPVIPGSPVYGIVEQVLNANSFVVNINSSAFTPFNVNQPVASVPGQNFPQVVAVGDLNTGGAQYSGGALYPSPYFVGENGNVSTINGPAIQGAFVNNTSQGFILGLGAAEPSGSPQRIFWEAFLYDYNAP